MFPSLVPCSRAGLGAALLLASIIRHPAMAIVHPKGHAHGHAPVSARRQSLRPPLSATQTPENFTNITFVNYTYAGAITAVCEILDIMEGEVTTTNETLTEVIDDSEEKTSNLRESLESVRGLALSMQMIIGQSWVEKVNGYCDTVESRLLGLWQPSADYLTQSRSNLGQIMTQLEADKAQEIQSLNAAADSTRLECGEVPQPHPEISDACTSTAGEAEKTLLVRVRQNTSSAWNPFGGSKSATPAEPETRPSADVIAEAVSDTTQLLTVVQEANATLDGYYQGLDQLLINAVQEINDTARQAVDTYCSGMPSQVLGPIEKAVAVVLRLADEQRVKLVERIQQKRLHISVIRNLSVPIYAYLNDLKYRASRCAALKTTTLGAAAAAATVQPSVAPGLIATTTSAAPATPAVVTPAVEASEITYLVLCSQWSSDVVGTSGCVDGPFCFFTDIIHDGSCSSTPIPISPAMLGTKIVYIQAGATQVSTMASVATLALPTAAPSTGLYVAILYDTEVVIYDGCDLGLQHMGMTTHSTNVGSLKHLCR